jgi:hypothetical protein
MKADHSLHCGHPCSTFEVGEAQVLKLRAPADFRLHDLQLECPLHRPVVQEHLCRTHQHTEQRVRCRAGQQLCPEPGGERLIRRFLPRNLWGRIDRVGCGLLWLYVAVKQRLKRWTTTSDRQSERRSKALRISIRTLHCTQFGRVRAACKEVSAPRPATSRPSTGRRRLPRVSRPGFPLRPRTCRR